MAKQELGQDNHTMFRDIEAEFRARPDHQAVETVPPLITMPTELEFGQMTAEREAREAVEKQRYDEGIQYWKKHERKQKWQSRGKKAMAAVAIVATFKSGGLIDMAGDEFSDAGRVAASAVPEPKPADFMPSGELDGIALEDYPQEYQDRLADDAEKEASEIAEARNTVLGLFGEVDEHGYDGVIKEVGEYQAEHPELFPSREVTESTHSTIDSSESNEATLSALGEFMKFYGINTGFDDDMSFDDRNGEIKEIAHAAVDVLSVLPKDFVELAALEDFTVSEDGSHGEDGSYSANSNRINIVPFSAIKNAVMPVEGFMQRSDTSYQGIIAHELGHALNEKIFVGAHLPDGEEIDIDLTGEEKLPVMPFVEHIARGIINRPEAPSVYARSGAEEFSAETLSGVLSDRSDGLAKTDEWRKFGSDSNKAMIQTLVDLERAYPGIAKILIANRLN